MSTKFLKMLFEVSEALLTEELAALKFLSLEHVPRGKLEDIQEPKAFFEVLQEKDMIGPENLFFLKELLYRISRIDLLTAHLGSSREEMERELQDSGRAQVSAYRQLLYEIAEDLTPDDIISVKFLLNKPTRNKLQSMLQVFLKMETEEKIKEDNLTMLKDLFQAVRPDIKKKIDAYEEKNKENKCSEEIFHYTDILHPCIHSNSKVLWRRESSLRKNYSREEVRYPVPVYPEERGAVGGAANQHEGIYKMENNPHGYCLIINNYIFKNPCHNREGTLQDGEAVKRVFTRLQFETVECMNLEGKQIYDTVEEYSKKDHSNMDCFVCFILSHGEKRKIKGVDDECVNIDELVSYFSGTNCRSLAGKPKVFIIQACQGSARHPSVSVEADSSGHLEEDASPAISIPDRADTLIGTATVEDYLAFRDRNTGSVYIQSLCKKMELLCPLRKDLFTILTEVNNEVARKEVAGCKQMPEIRTTLRKRLIFEVPQGN